MWNTFRLFLNCLITLKCVFLAKLRLPGFSNYALFFVIFAMPHSMILIDYCVFQQNKSFVSAIFSFIGWSFSKLWLWHPLVMRGSSSGSPDVSHTWQERYAPWVCSSSRGVRKSAVSDCARAAEACWMQSWLQSARASQLLSNICARGAVTIRVRSKTPEEAAQMDPFKSSSNLITSIHPFSTAFALWGWGGDGACLSFLGGG